MLKDKNKVSKLRFETVKILNLIHIYDIKSFIVFILKNIVTFFLCVKLGIYLSMNTPGVAAELAQGMFEAKLGVMVMIVILYLGLRVIIFAFEALILDY